MEIAAVSFVKLNYDGHATIREFQDASEFDNKKTYNISYFINKLYKHITI
jgi:hypothetical protein